MRIGKSSADADSSAEPEGRDGGRITSGRPWRTGILPESASRPRTRAAQTPRIKSLTLPEEFHVIIQGFPFAYRSAVPRVLAQRPGKTSRRNPPLNQESTMYAVIKTGGKQYRVAPGEKIKIEQIPADVGAQIVLDQVLMVADGERREAW